MNDRDLAHIERERVIAELKDRIAAKDAKIADLEAGRAERERVKGGAFPAYEDSDSPELRVEKCIRYELEHGGDAEAAASAVIRDSMGGYFGSLLGQNAEIAALREACNVARLAMMEPHGEWKDIKEANAACAIRRALEQKP